MKPIRKWQKEQEEKAKAEVLKKEKEAQKKAIKNARKNFRNLAKEKNMFAADEDEKVKLKGYLKRMHY